MTIDELSARLEKVERANRRMRTGGVLALVLLAAGVAMGQAVHSEKVIRAQRFEVVDDQGRTWAVLGDTGDAKWPSLTMLSPIGKTPIGKWDCMGIQLGVRGESQTADLSAGLGLMVDSHDGRAHARVGPSMVSVVADGAESTRGVSLTVGEYGHGVHVTDGGVIRAALGVMDLKVTSTGATERTAASSITLFDKDGKVLERLPK